MKYLNYLKYGEPIRPYNVIPETLIVREVMVAIMFVVVLPAMILLGFSYIAALIMDTFRYIRLQRIKRQRTTQRNTYPYNILLSLGHYPSAEIVSLLKGDWTS
jgi:hypothetical protein